MATVGQFSWPWLGRSSWPLTHKGDTPYITVQIDPFETPESGEYVIEFIYNNEVQMQVFFTIRQAGGQDRWPK